MGFMTEVSILNDRWDEIRKNPADFVEQLYANSMSMGRDCRFVIGQTTVAPTHHADDIRVYFSGRNSFFDAFPNKNMTLDRLHYQLDYLTEMKRYISLAQKETKELLAKGVSSAPK